MQIRRITWPAMLTVLALALCADLALAHSLYIQSGRHRVSEGKQSPLFFGFGHHIPVDEGVRPDMLAAIKVFDPAGRVKELAPREETGLQSQMVEYSEPGVYVLTAETAPGHYTMWQDKKGHQHHTMKPMSAVADQASKIEKSIYFRSFTKTYVRCGEPGGAFAGRVGLGLELVPSQDPTGLKAGDTLTLRVFRDGRPYAGEGRWTATYDGYSTEAMDLYQPGRTVTGDAFAVSLDRPGRWYISYSCTEDAAQDDRKEYLQLRQATTLTVLVPNERKQPRPKKK
jgi:uncharacterized GH25 family protein